MLTLTAGWGSLCLYLAQVSTVADEDRDVVLSADPLTEIPEISRVRAVEITDPKDLH